MGFWVDARHEKTDLKVSLVVIPKEGWARPPTFQNFIDWCLHWLDRGASRVSVPLSSDSKLTCLGMTTTKTLRSVFSWRSSADLMQRPDWERDEGTEGDWGLSTTSLTATCRRYIMYSVVPCFTANPCLMILVTSSVQVSDWSPETVHSE